MRVVCQRTEQMDKVIVLKNSEQSTNGLLIWVMLQELPATFVDRLDRQHEQIRRQMGGERVDPWIFRMVDLGQEEEQ
jgi:hypothetical protein